MSINVIVVKGLAGRRRCTHLIRGASAAVMPFGGIKNTTERAALVCYLVMKPNASH